MSLRRVTIAMAAISIAMFVGWAWQSRSDGCNTDSKVDREESADSTAETETPWRGEEPHESDEPEGPYPIPSQFRRDAEAQMLCGLCPKHVYLPTPPTPVDLTLEEKDALAARDPGGIDQWGPRLAPVLGAPPPLIANGNRELFQQPAPVARAVAQRAPASTTVWQRHLIDLDVREALRSGWIDPSGLAQMIGLRKAVNGRDALFAGWQVAGRRFRVVSTGPLLIGTTLDESCGSTARQRLAAAVALAQDLFNVPGELCSAIWHEVQLGEFVLGWLNVDYETMWYQTLAIVTDGKGVEYSFYMIHGPRHVDGTYVPRKDVPWFDQELLPSDKVY